MIKICKINHITNKFTIFVINKYVINLLPISYSTFGSPINTELWTKSIPSPSNFLGKASTIAMCEVIRWYWIKNDSKYL